MNIKRALTALINVVAEEAAKNPEFMHRLEDALSAAKPVGKKTSPAERVEKKRGGRRPAALLDPIEVVRSGEHVLRAKLAELELDQLIDVVAQFGMDPSKLVMKWKDRDRVIAHIVERSVARATKGDAFREGS